MVPKWRKDGPTMPSAVEISHFSQMPDNAAFCDVSGSGCDLGPRLRGPLSLPGSSATRQR
jgi:hypothetical protein